MFRPRWVAPVVFVGLMAIVLAVRFAPLFQAPLLEEGDLAVNALQIRHAKQVRELYGNYSRYEFNHPGPAFFYVYAAAEALLFDAAHVVPSPGNAHLVAIVALQLAFLTTALWLIATRFPWRPLAALTLLAATVGVGRHPEIVVSVWPPHVLVVPLLGFLVACTCVAAGDVAVLPVAVLAGGFLFHGHVAQALFVTTIGTAALVMGGRAWRAGAVERKRGIFAAHRGTFVLGGLLVLLFALPLLVDVLTLGARSNVAAIFGRFAANAGRHASLRQSVLFFLTYPVASREQDALLTAGLAPAIGHFVQGHWIGILAGVAILLAPAAWLAVARHRLAPDERRLASSGLVLLTVAVADCVVWGLAQSGAVRHYNGVFFQAVYFYALLFGLAILARVLARRWSGYAEFGVAALAMVILALGLHAHAAGAVERGVPVERAVDAALAATPDRRPKLLVVARGNWPIAAAVALELRRRGVNFFVPDWWGFMFQRRHEASRLAATNPSAETWWIAPAGAGGIDLASGLALYRQPAALDPNGASIDFMPRADAFRYVVTGVQDGDFIGSAPTDGMTTNERRVLFRFVPLPARHDVKITFDAESAVEGHPRMPAEVFLNGEAVGRVSVQNRSTVVVGLARRRWNRLTEATLELRFPAARACHSRARPDYTGWTGWRIWSIRFEPGAEGGADAPPPQQAGAPAD